MDLSLTEDQEQLKRTAEDFMQRECPKDVLLSLEHTDAGFTDSIWQTAADIGWLGMVIPAAYGGSGNSLTDAAVVFEQVGRGPLPGPFFSSSVLGALVLLEACSEEQKQQYLPGIANGREIIALALTEPGYGWAAGSVQMRAEERDGSFILNGTKLFVHDAVSSSRLVCAVRTGRDDDPERGITLLMVDTSADGVSTRLLPGFLGWVGEVLFEGVEVSASAVLGEVGAGWEPLQRAIQKSIPVLSAYQVGGAQAVFDMSVEYSRSRVQFGTPIGRFQRVQDHIIGMVNHVDAARWTTYEALWKLDSGMPAETSVHLAKAVATEGYFQACNGAHEVHAGVGVVRDYGLTMHTKMSRTLYHYLGDPRYHRRRLAGTLDL